MSNTDTGLTSVVELASSWSPDARTEMDALGLQSPSTDRIVGRPGLDPLDGRPAVPRFAINASDVLNEAFHYHPRPSSFSRGLRVPLSDVTLLFLSGTASIDERGQTVYPGDFQAQCLRTFRNLTRLLASESASWHDVVRTTCYLRDIERDYDSFNEVRTLFMSGSGLDPLPASTGIQARLCRSDLLVEIEATAVVPRDGGR